MKMEYSQTADALYVSFVDTNRVARTVEIDNGTVVDLLQDGRVAGIEVLVPARAWPIDEIADRFDLELDDVLALRSLWFPEGRYPFVRSPEPVPA